jgi:hypothetical protein
MAPDEGNRIQKAQKLMADIFTRSTFKVLKRDFKFSDQEIERFSKSLHQEVKNNERG